MDNFQEKSNTKIHSKKKYLAFINCDHQRNLDVENTKQNRNISRREVQNYPREALFQLNFPFSSSCTLLRGAHNFKQKTMRRRKRNVWKRVYQETLLKGKLVSPAINTTIVYRQMFLYLKDITYSNEYATTNVALKT